MGGVPGEVDMVGRAPQEQKEDWDAGPGSAARKPREPSQLLTFSERTGVLGQMTANRAAHDDRNSLSQSGAGSLKSRWGQGRAPS